MLEKPKKRKTFGEDDDEISKMLNAEPLERHKMAYHNNSCYIPVKAIGKSEEQANWDFLAFMRAGKGTRIIPMV